MNISDTLNQDYIDAQYGRWKEDPGSVSRDWQFFFEGFTFGLKGSPAEESVCDEDQALRQAGVEALIHRYRDIGHLLSCTDPLAACPMDHPLLDISTFNLTVSDMTREFHSGPYLYGEKAQLQDVVFALKETYCKSIGVEFTHIQDPEEREWLLARMEPVRNQPNYDDDVKKRILKKLYQAAVFEDFLNKKYAAQTRFSLEGAESLIPMLDFLTLHATENGCREIILGMAHRGRLNVQVNILGKSYKCIFQEFINSYDPESITGAGDVKYHNGYLNDIELDNGRMLRVHLINNPSHLESVNSVVEGVARARQDRLPRNEKASVLPLLIHGDAAFAGQGVVAETLNMSQLPGYRTGGTLHIVINNQIGYTTLPENARSTRYSTDVAKMLMSPIFHVHGENPEAVLHAVQLAYDYRNEFGKDAIIDLVCYRRYGHNEGDEPYFTQPLMYERIRSREPVHKMYATILLDDGALDENELVELEESITEKLDEEFEEARKDPGEMPTPALYEEWKGYHCDYVRDHFETGVETDILIELATKLNAVPEGFSIYNKLERLLSKRLKAVQDGEGIDWANAESLAFASILSEGVPVRMSGQDSGRGTFSQRHAVLVDIETGEKTVPLNRLSDIQGKFTVLNSLLAEAGVLGFEYGYSITRPDGLVIWEAQFGDFANNAQSIIDLYIASGETKWRRMSGLTMFLPHGWEGLGPEHSSARVERFLELCAEDNMQVCNLTTPAQLFHLLRKQALAKCRKPLILLTPKSLLRNPLAVSRLEDMVSGSFNDVLDDPAKIKKRGLKRVILTSGKVYYELFQRRDELKADNIALIRVEQYYPFPAQSLKKVLDQYKNAKEWYWVQEEPENMGAYRFLRPKLEELLDKKIGFIGRAESSSPATGFANMYRMQQAAITNEAIGPAPETK